MQKNFKTVIHNQRSEESKRKETEKKIPNPRLEESKRNVQQGLWTRQYLNKMQNCHKQEKERKETRACDT